MSYGNDYFSVGLETLCFWNGPSLVFEDALPLYVVVSHHGDEGYDCSQWKTCEESGELYQCNSFIDKLDVCGAFFQ